MGSTESRACATSASYSSSPLYSGKDAVARIVSPDQMEPGSRFCSTSVEWGNKKTRTAAAAARTDQRNRGLRRTRAGNASGFSPVSLLKAALSGCGVCVVFAEDVAIGTALLLHRECRG